MERNNGSDRKRTQQVNLLPRTITKKQLENAWEKQAELIFNPQGGLKPLDSRVILTAAGGNPRYQNSGITVFTFKTTARRFGFFIKRKF